MSRNVYDNWERLVGAVLKREELWQLALAYSSDSSLSSLSGSFNYGLDSPIQEQIIQLEASSSEVNQNPATDATSTGPSTSTPAALRNFTFADLKKATKNFSSDLVLGYGDLGTVYKGSVDPRKLEPSKAGKGMAVAVKIYPYKRLKLSDEWQAELNFLGRRSHPNLVKLLGYCLEDNEWLLLVYEFMQRGSLENHLFKRTANEALSWDVRLKIATEAARGLAFLRTLDKPVIHSHFKASNILLDKNYSAKISGFRLAKLGPSERDPHLITRVMGRYGYKTGGVMGRYGYAAPEYIAVGHLCVKSDVYSFGVVLLEMLTGLRLNDYNRPSSQRNLVDYAKPFLSKKLKLMGIVDARMEGQYPLEAALQAGKLTLKCLEDHPRNRPSMEQVVETLQQIAAIQQPKETENNQSSMHSSSRNTRVGS